MSERPLLPAFIEVVKHLGRPCPCAQAQAQGQGQDGVGRVVAATARRQNFSQAFQRTLLFEVAVFLACFLLVFLLPDLRGDAAAQRPGAAA
jgi:hypothetical protein